MSSDEESDGEILYETRLPDGAYDRPLFLLYTDLKTLIRDSVSKDGSGWARKRPNTAFQLHDILLQLAHWLTDIDDHENATLSALERDDKAFASHIRTNLIFAQIYSRELRVFLEKSTSDSKGIDVESEAALIKGIRTSVQGLQQQVDPLLVFADARKGEGIPGAIEEAVKHPDVLKRAGLDSGSPKASDWSPDDGELRGTKQVAPVVTTENRGIDTRVTDLIRESALINNDGKRFWPTRLLRKLMPREKVFQALEECSGLPKNKLSELADRILPYSRSQETCNGFLKVFFILLLMEKGDCIMDFIANDLGDDRLPLSKEHGSRRAFLFDGTRLGIHDSTFNDWKVFEIEFFLETQWQVLTPALDPKNLQVLTVDRNTILPWLGYGKERSDRHEGGFGSVRKVKVHQTSLSSDEMLLSHVAVKTVHPTQAQHFDNEFQALYRVNSLKHQHLISLLAAYRSDGGNVLVFPWAESDLEQYWETHPGPLKTMNREDVDSPKPKHTWEEVKWVSEQLHGIAGALAAMHNPSAPWHCVHGDLKPSNLLLMAADGSRGRLVIGDFGLAQLQLSDENDITSPRDHGFTPAYRPPEVDIKMAPKSKSRLYDIWSLGCVFSEMICWMLGGYELKADFEARRAATDLNGNSSYTFFEIVSESDHYVSRIKPAVTQFFDELRALPQCTPHTQDLINIVQYDMLVVSSDVKKRIHSKELVRRLETIHTRVHEDMSYATGPVTVPFEPHTDSPSPVKVVPSESAGALEKKMAAILASGSLAAMNAYRHGIVSDTAAWAAESRMSGKVSDSLVQMSRLTAVLQMSKLTASLWMSKLTASRVQFGN